MVCESQTTTFFDVRVVDSDASSYVQRDVNAVLSSIEHFKKQKYSQAAECVHASFTPFVVTADGALGVEGKAFMRLRLSEKIATTWHKSNSNYVCYPSCYKFVHSWESGEMEEKDGDRRRSRTSRHAGVTLSIN